MSEQELAGKTAIVSGAGRNIGRAIAVALAEAGASVSIVVRANKAEADAVVKEIEGKFGNSGGQALALLADIGDPRAVQAVADATLKQFRRIDILVNNAAVRREKSIDDMIYADWREVMNVTLDGAFHCVKACLPALKKNGGAIVNIGGLSAHIGSKHRAHVTAAKLGIVGFTRGLAHDLAADHITVNCVVPGAIDTARGAGPKPAHHLTHGTITDTRGRPEDVAAMVRFLCGPSARHITGQALHVSGGAYLGT